MWYVLKYMCVYFKKFAMALIFMVITKPKVYIVIFKRIWEFRGK